MPANRQYANFCKVAKPRSGASMSGCLTQRSAMQEVEEGSYTRGAVGGVDGLLFRVHSASVLSNVFGRRCRGCQKALPGHVRGSKHGN